MKLFLLSLALTFLVPTLAEENALFAFVTLKTSMGDIRLKLYKKEAPRTVENFIGLATGEKSYRDNKTGKKVVNTPFYKDMIFHKVHPKLGIQSGCPWGNGKGWPGYTVKEEKNELKFDRPFLVTMAKIEAADNSSGSQFFITTEAAPHLNKKYTVFGEVISGQGIVSQMSQVKRDAMMKPIQPIKLHEIVVENN